MALLLISFTNRLETASKNKEDFYKESLLDQYKRLRKRLKYKDYSFEDFIEECFPSGIRKNYYLSCPNFLREKHELSSGKASYLNNIVIRPELTASMEAILPAEQNIILIGDIFENNKTNKIQIKGIQLIESSLSSPNDYKVCCEACNAFSTETIPGRNTPKPIIVDSWMISDWKTRENILTPDFIDTLIEECFTVKNPAEVRRTYDKWRKYIDFRKYYLSEQSKRNFYLNNVSYIESYAINKKEYWKNKSIYDEYLLDGLEAFSKGEMIVLSSKVEAAESFPLIRLNIDRNKKAFLDARTIKGSRLVNEEEMKIRSLAKDNVFITQKDPLDLTTVDRAKYNEVFRDLLIHGYTLGDRFKIVSYDIQPTEHINQLEQDCKNEINSSFKSIDQKYDAIIEKELHKAINEEKLKLENSYLELISREEQRLTQLLPQDVRENNDPTVLSIIKKEKELIRHSTLRKKDEDNENYQHRLNILYSQINIESLYKDRNQKLIEALKQSKSIEVKHAIAVFMKSKQNELHAKYNDDIRNEKIIEDKRLKDLYTKKKEEAITNETIKRFSIYFRLQDTSRDIKEKEVEIIEKCKYIVYDNRAEKAKIKRQETALENFYAGYVKNPYLSTYLFNPESLKPTVDNIDSNWIWYLESLNERQKEAVRKAVASNGVFLLQGPPGTGKTQVIAETVAQMVHKGKKVLISSETHKAIDNVFERLPKTAEIIPIRLIPSNNDKKKDNNYDPRFLVDNFYTNISDSMKKAISRYSSFKRNKEEFSSEFSKLKLLSAKIEKSQSILDDAKAKISAYEKQAKQINSIRNNERDKQEDILLTLDTLKRTRRHIEKNHLAIDDDIDQTILSNYIFQVKKLLSAYLDDFSSEDLGNVISEIERISMTQVHQELSLVNPDNNEIIADVRKAEIREKMRLCKDELDEIIEGKEEEFKKLQGELKQILNANKSSKTPSLQLSSIFKYPFIVKHITDLDSILDNLKNNILESKADFFETQIDTKIEALLSKKDTLDKKIDDLNSQIRDINHEIITIQEENDVVEIKNDQAKLESNIARFFRDFEISNPYTSIKEALTVIKQKWDHLESDYLTKEIENKEKIPMYEKISNYISSPDIIEQDRRIYTRQLFESANVFGITCTSNDKFTGNNIDALSEYSLDNIDIKTVGIDVVIIDEVSKSSFIDLLIPILYGKTIILVGDHRQLPPMYEFAKLRDEDFEGLDADIINPEINSKFTKLYEECFFKTLFENIPNTYKTMLVQQYRCHQDIMEVFNHFYSGELKIGFPGQNNQKQHNIRLISNGQTTIEPQKHVYFIDCKQTETHEQDSTSMYNTGEAKVVASLISQINTYFKSHKTVDDEKLSIGVICTYGDQARRIKEIMKTEKVKTDAFKGNSEKMIVSTVDDFQGDERDIIILSMVRNPENPNRSNPGFILAYQRINVALSRARRLLVIVGNRKYLEQKGVIYLPDVNGNTLRDKKNFRVYEEILETIETRGKVLEDTDILVESEVRING